MSRQLPTAADFICGHQTAMQTFKMNRVVGTTTVDGVDYSLIYGTFGDTAVDNDLKQSYQVVCYDDLFGWRGALLRQPGYPDGFNYLGGQVIPPTVQAADAKQSDVVFDLRCTEADGVVMRSVLRPYRLPIVVGEGTEDNIVTAVGRPLFFGDNYSGIVPVQFKVGHGLLFCWGETLRWYQSSNPEVTRLLAESLTMPTIQNGIGANTWHVMVTEHGQDVLLKLFFNGKGARREDEVHR